MNRQSDSKHEVKIAITAASYSGNKGAAAMLQSSKRMAAVLVFI